MLQIFKHIAFYIALPLLLSSCTTIRGIKEVSCHLADTISQRDLRLASIYHSTIGDRDTICNTDRYLEEIGQLEIDTGIIYIRTVLDKEYNIESMYVYDDNRSLLYCWFRFIYDSENRYNSVPIGREYTFNSQGDITEIENHEEGYSICHEQAMYIGDRYSKWKASKKLPERALGRGIWHGKKIWKYHYTDRKRQRKMLVIDGCSGKILKKYDVLVTY